MVLNLNVLLVCTTVLFNTYTSHCSVLDCWYINLPMTVWGITGVNVIRVFQSASNIFLSLLLGAFAIALCAIYLPELLEALQIRASHLKDDILWVLTSLGTTANVNVWIRFLVQDEQLVFMGFVIVMRIFLALLMWSVSSVFNKLTQW